MIKTFFMLAAIAALADTCEPPRQRKCARVRIYPPTVAKYDARAVQSPTCYIHAKG